jgi:N,N'-diacetyllegionaminate synthase
MSTFIIAEAGVNHNGDVTRALAMVDAAADAGADAVKFQTFNAVRLVTAGAPKAAYQERSGGAQEGQLAMLSRLELPLAAHHDLIERCKARGIEFLSTGFDIQSMDALRGLGVSRYKIPSGEIDNTPYLRHIASFEAPLIMSTGTATLAEVEAALDTLLASGAQREQVTVLHCTTSYPTPLEDVNLRAMITIRETLGVAVGYSDHTLGIEVPIAAVAMGAEVIEKHFTLDRRLPGPDHVASLEPAELAAMVRGIRSVELALGSAEKRPTAAEERIRHAIRKSIVASRPIRAGEQYTAECLTTKRPAGGISPARWDDVVGRVAPRDFALDEAIEL